MKTNLKTALAMAHDAGAAFLWDDRDGIYSLLEPNVENFVKLQRWIHFRPDTHYYEVRPEGFPVHPLKDRSETR